MSGEAPKITVNVKEVESVEKLADPVDVEADVDLESEFESEDEDAADLLPGLRKRLTLSTRFETNCILNTYKSFHFNFHLLIRFPKPWNRRRWKTTISTTT